MAELNIQIIKKNGKKEFVILPYEEFLKVQEELDDYENLRCLREAKKAEQSAPTVSLDELKKSLNIQTR
jgi:PHD/YefM family antitoxin component YafN of YafNO toxin-antitoxin module